MDGTTHLIIVEDAAVADAGEKSSGADSSNPVGRGRLLCEQLERGNILLFTRTPFAFSPEKREFLLSQRQTNATYHKNVAYRPDEDRLTGLAKSDAAEEARLRAILRAYSEQASQFVSTLLSPYKNGLRRDFASYRPVEERGRPARLRARNDLPHVDAFPTRPTNGDRILRVFTNLNPTQNRVWLTAETFDVIAERYARQIGFPTPRTGFAAQAGARLARVLRWPGAGRAPYDDFMHRCHNFMKENDAFRAACPTQRWEFAPDATWMVYTDMVSHAVLEGQFAMEQTFIVSRHAMVLPAKSPISILERLCGHTLSNPNKHH
ncbi:MAG TPA: Kdo hydroxylase family protein [Candidatus Dormibacteraeota bacterium]|nr:Kdo hydroxylase family protein [Candidatus Dormibacteraeota bacterium]